MLLFRGARTEEVDKYLATPLHAAVKGMRHRNFGEED